MKRLPTQFSSHAPMRRGISTARPLRSMVVCTWCDAAQSPLAFKLQPNYLESTMKTLILAMVCGSLMSAQSPTTSTETATSTTQTTKKHGKETKTDSVSATARADADGSTSTDSVKSTTKTKRGHRGKVKTETNTSK